MLVVRCKINEIDSLPIKAHKTDAGYDLTAVRVERIGLFCYKYWLGVSLEIPENYEGQIRPRSSVFKTGMILSNSVGTIDSGFRGELSAVFWKIPFISKPYKVGDRVCQLLIKPLMKVMFLVQNELSKSDRGDCGYGSTGR